MIILPGIAASSLRPPLTANPAPVIIDAINSSPGLVSSLNVTMPSYAIGDLLLVIGDRTNTGGAAPTATPAGWTVLRNDNWASGDKLFVIAKIATSLSESLNINYGGATTYMGARCFSIRGAHPDVLAIATSAAGGSDPPFISFVDDFVPDNALIFTGSVNHPNGPATIPTGYTEGGNPQRVHIAYKTVAGAISEDPPTYSSGGAISVTIAVPAVRTTASLAKQNIVLTTGGVPNNAYVQFMGKRWLSGPSPANDWNKGGSRTTRKVEDGNFYFELTVTQNVSNSTLCFGVATPGIGLTTATGFPNNAGEAGRHQYFEDGRKRSGGIYAGYGPTFTQGNVIGIGIANEGGSTILRAYKDGVNLGVMYNLGAITGLWEPHICRYGGGVVATQVDLRDILYMPAGHVRW